MRPSRQHAFLRLGSASWQMRRFAKPPYSGALLSASPGRNRPASFLLRLNPSPTYPSIDATTHPWSDRLRLHHADHADLALGARETQGPHRTPL